MNNPTMSYRRVAGFTAIVVLVLVAILVAAGNLLDRPATLAPIPVASVAYNTHPGDVSVPGVPVLRVSEHDNVAYVTWRDPGAAGVSSVSVTIAVGGSCSQGANWFYQHAVLAYPAAKNVDQATNQPIAGRPDKGNAYWQYAPGNTYSASVTVTNAGGTSAPSSCTVFGIPQSDPMPAA